LRSRSTSPRANSTNAISHLYSRAIVPEARAGHITTANARPMRTAGPADARLVRREPEPHAP
jgi:hypothetical protein